MQDGCKMYMDFYMASNGSCFMVFWNEICGHYEIKLLYTVSSMRKENAKPTKGNLENGLIYLY